MNKIVENVISASFAIITAPVWIPVYTVKGIATNVTNKKEQKDDVIDQKEPQVELGNNNTANNMKETNKGEIEMEEKILTKVNYKDIKNVKLIYPDEIYKDMKAISKILSIKDFDDFQKRIEDAQLGSGYTALFYGAPGTGKTESVLQIAKRCGRTIYKIDIADIQSKYIGETGSRVRRTFKAYSNLCRNAKQRNQPIPILLINEADALLSKRHGFDGCNPVSIQDNNQVQNILLEEFENNKGIIFMTTNMGENLDEAFERRIFDRIKFRIPDAKTRAKIWKDKVKFLSDEQINIIARDFKLSGGDINVISRNIIKNQIVNNRNPSFNEIYKMCKSYKIHS